MVKAGTVPSAILVISEGPPPLGDTVSEGGALRAWGLAKGLAHYGHEVTLAYRSTFKMADNADLSNVPKGIRIATWDDKKIDALLEKHLIVVMRYAMGEAELITTRMSTDHILVSDNYIPISVEVSARRSDHKDENLNYLRLQNSSAQASRRADYILYASPSQHLYYLGYLSGINKLSPVTYDALNERMFEVPYGVDPAEKPEQLPAAPTEPTLLWYGAFYSWFDMETLIPAFVNLKKQIPGFKLLIAGAKNPYNKDPGLLAHYDKTMKALATLGDTVEHIPWQAYDKRYETYARASAIITYNHEGLENLLAWRTRLMDFVLADRPVLTNGGDPLGEDLIRRGIAFRVTEQTLSGVFASLMKKSPAPAAYTAAAEAYSWINLTADLAKTLKSPSRLVQVDMELKETPFRKLIRSIKHLLLSPKIVARYIQRHGLRRTISRIIKGR